MTSYKLILGAITAVLLGMTAQVGWAEECDEEYDVDFFVEINATDGDAGVQLLLDGEQWTELEITDPDGDVNLEVTASDSIDAQGLTEFFFESAEPSFDDQSLADFLALFPEGDYEFEGVLTDGGDICGTAEFTHDLPGAPEISAKLTGKKLTISWEEADGPFPGGSTDPIEVESYEVIAEIVDGDVDFRMVLPAEATEVTLPRQFVEDTGPDDEVKYEVICKEVSGNQTLSERTDTLGDL